MRATAGICPWCDVVIPLTPHQEFRPHNARYINGTGMHEGEETCPASGLTRRRAEQEASA